MTDCVPDPVPNVVKYSTSSSITVLWEPPTNCLSGITEYEIEYKYGRVNVKFYIKERMFKLENLPSKTGVRVNIRALSGCGKLGLVRKVFVATGQFISIKISIIKIILLF